MQISFRKLELIKQHAVQVFPEECCGLLAGKRETMLNGSLENVIHEIAPCRNRAWWNRIGSFEIALSDYLDVEREAIQAGYTVIGTYHSHTDAGAFPSQQDYESAPANHTSLIVAVRSGIVADARAWIHKEQSPFAEEKIHIRL
ncbi:MAG: M67 family metallopeptidase [Rhizobacter sp.]|nr:M67 family metallopeptidase [Chlorobiales bacterium]